MISGKNTGFFLLFLLIWSCQPQGYSERQNIEWEADIFLEEGAKWKLEKYFKLLEAETVEISSDISYEEENDKELLTVQINNSEFLMEKSEEEKEMISERLGFLIFSYLMYPYSYQSITFYHAKQADEGGIYSTVFKRSYSPEQFDIEIEEFIEND